MSTVETTAVRAVTDEEVESFFQNGWARLPEMISADSAARLLDRAKGILGEDATIDRATGRASEYTSIQAFERVSREDEVFKSLATSPGIGRAAARMLGRDSAIRLLIDTLAVKLPISKVSHRGQPTELHQDYTRQQPFDRCSLNFWFALDHVSAEQGPVRFHSGSHAMGQLGNLHTPGLVEGWQSRLDRFPLSDKTPMAPGDATVHLSTTVHGAPANTGDAPRWGYIVVCFPADALYTNLPTHYTDGLGLVAYQPLEHPNFPVIYDPQTWSSDD